MPVPVATLHFASFLLLAGCQADTVRIGDVQFTTSSIPVDGADVAAADFNNDGHPDLAGGGEPLTIFLGDENGRLSVVSQVAGGASPTGFAVADLDGDGNTDIVVANHDTDYLTILLGDGTGGFEPAPSSPFTVQVDPHPHAVAAEDIDGDGLLDLVVDDRNGNGLRIYRGLGRASFETPGRLVDVGGDPYIGMAIGDLNGDGGPDFVTPNPSNLAVVLQSDRGTLSYESPVVVAAEDPFGVALADFNGDGNPDVISVSGENASSVVILHGDGKGGFSRSEESRFEHEEGPKIVATGDFSGDGHPDAAVACYRSSEVLIILGGPGSYHTVTVSAGAHPWGLAVADFNSDGRDDLVIADDGRPEAMVLLSVRD